MPRTIAGIFINPANMRRVLERRIANPLCKCNSCDTPIGPSINVNQILCLTTRLTRKIRSKPIHLLMEAQIRLRSIGL